MASLLREKPDANVSTKSWELQVVDTAESASYASAAVRPTRIDFRMFARFEVVCGRRIPLPRSRRIRRVAGLKLTIQQACRLWNVDTRICELALKTLVEDGVLARTARGTYIMLPGAEQLLKPALTIRRCPHCQKLNTFRQDDDTSRCPACHRLLAAKPAVA